ncbi:hypothetical protein BN128_3152 [Cronobacter sakazakii 696]|nr:hypothetical protein BN128_3152 [Cronobacter sakazakii 696]
MRCDARFTADIKKTRYCEADIDLLLMVNLLGVCPVTFWHCGKWT